jgi:general secretion pathway protein A
LAFDATAAVFSGVGLPCGNGLKWNPFAPGVPAEALHVSPRVDSFCRRVRHLIAEGGFAVVIGDPGTGKSTCLRILAEQLAGERDVKVGMISRPQANIADFYREMGDLYGVQLRPHNRWGGAKIPRQSWQAHIDSALSRPVLIVDEAQEMGSTVRSELRLLTSAKLDSYPADRRPRRRRPSRREPAFQRVPGPRPPHPRPSADRARYSRDSPGLSAASVAPGGAPALMTPEVIATLADHAQGNLRSLMIMADELARTL